MKSFKTILSEVAAPKSADEKAFRDKHLVQVMAHPVAADYQYTGDVDDGIVDPLTAKQRRLADYKKGEDMKVYENIDLADKDVDKRLERERQQHIRKKIIDEKKMDPAGQEDGDIDNDGDVDKSDNYLHNRRKAIRKAMKESISLISEKAKSEAQQKAAGIALAVKRGDMPKSALQGASAAMYKMSEKDLEDFARTKHKGIPEKVSEETEQLDELSPSTLKSYRNKATDQLDKDWQDTRKGKPGLSDRVVSKRVNGVEKAYQKLKKEEVELDEISTNLARSYIRKASADNKERKTQVMKPFPLKDMEKNVADHKKFKKREAGIETAGKKVWEIGGKAKVPATESVELDENIKNMSDARLKFHATTDTPHGTYGRKEIKDEHNRRMKWDSIYQKTKALYTKEEVELDEISKKTLGSYIKKASGNMAANAAVAAAQASSSMKKSTPEVKRNIANRMKGITRASDKLAKEEVELDEAVFDVKKLPGYKKSTRNSVGNTIHHFNDSSKVYSVYGQSPSGRKLQYHKITADGDREVHSQTSLKKSFMNEEVELTENLGKASKKMKFWYNTDPRDVKNRLKNADPAFVDKLAKQPEGKLSGPAELQRRLAIKMKKEETDLIENFKAGAVKLNDGSSVTVKDQDAKLLNQLFKDLNAENKKKMMKVAMTDKNGFNEILGFAREAL